jgi:3-deoxy-D-manno-octulosonic-acid transferase
MSAALVFYRAATGLAEPLAPALLHGRMRRGKEDPARLPERLGRASRPRPEGPLAWLHGASVGEALSLLPLIERLRHGRPDLNLLVTSGTTTSAELLARRLPPGVIHQYAPVDAPRAAQRFLGSWRPDLAVFVESELWPNLLTQARARGVRLAVVSARMSENSARNWRRMPGAARSLFEGFDLVLPQDDLAAARLAALGARDGGRLNLKLAGDPLPVDAAVLEAARRAAGDRPLLLAASTHPGEEEIAFEAFQAITSDRPEYAARLVVVPRHPVRGAGIAARAQQMGFSTWLRSEEGLGSEAGSPDAEVWVADALGELGLWFRLAASALIGGSLAEDIGGHNPLEPARLDCPVVAGPHTEGWAAVYRALDEAGAVARADGAEALERAWRADLEQPRAARARAERARRVAEAGRGELDHAVGRLLELVP